MSYATEYFTPQYANENSLLHSPAYDSKCQCWNLPNINTTAMVEKHEELCFQIQALGNRNWMIFRCILSIWGCVHRSVYPSVRRSIGPSVRPSVHPSVGNLSFQMSKMSGFLCENNRHSPTLTLLNELHVLDLLNMPTDTSLACWALLLKTWCWLSVEVIHHRW